MSSQTVPSDFTGIPAAQQIGLMNLSLAALDKNPRNLSALLTVAGLFTTQGNHADAVSTLQKALAVARKDPEVLRRLVKAAATQGDLVLARRYARKLCEVAPRDPFHHKQHGVVLDKLGFPDAAIQSYLKADRLQPGNAETLHCIGRSYGMMGNHQRALEYHRKALEADPGYGHALYAYAAARKFGADEAETFVAQVEAALPMAANAPIAANLRYGAGKVLDDAGRHDEAFEWYRRANDASAPKKPTAILPPFVNSAEAFTREFLKTRAGYGLDTRQPIFIVGMPRSGTTLTESLCGAHSRVTAGDERSALGVIARRLGRDSDVDGAYARVISALTREEVAVLAGEYMERLKTVADATPHFTDKMPHNFLDIGLIALIFPNAKIIHCRRHPLDNCLSLYANSMVEFHNRYKTDLAKLGRYYRQYLKLMEHWRAVLPGRIHEVYYEDMVANTEFNARAMVDYLGLEWEDGVMTRSGSQRSVRTLSHWQVRQPVYQTSKGKWQHYERHLGPLLDTLGEASVAAYEAELADLAPQGAAASAA